MTSHELTTIIDAFATSRPKAGHDFTLQWTRCVNSFVTHSVTRNTLTEAQVDDFYFQLNERRIS